MMTGVRQGPGALRFSLLAAVVAVCMTGMLLGEAGRAVAHHDPTWFAAALAAVYGVYYGVALCVVEPFALTASDRAGLVALTAVVAYALLLLATGRFGTGPGVGVAFLLVPPIPILTAVWLGRRRRMSWDSHALEGEYPTIDALLRSQRLRRPWTATSLPAAGSWFFPPPKNRPLNLDAQWSELGPLSQPDVTLRLLVKAQRLRRPWPVLPEETPCALLTPPAGSAQSR
jgi:hypothetical protein